MSRTPRSNPALYCEAWELIRDLYTEKNGILDDDGDSEDGVVLDAGDSDGIEAGLEESEGASGPASDTRIRRFARVAAIANAFDNRMAGI